MVLAMTHEEVVADLLRDLVKSYRQLPMIVYHFQTKFRDEPRSRGGLIRVREFVMKDSYTLDADAAGLDRSYQAHYQAYEKIFARIGLDAVAVASDVGIMGGTEAHEFMVLNEHGEDTLVICESCGYAANQQIAELAVKPPAAEELLPTEEIATPETPTIASLAELLGVGTDRTAKATFFVTADGRLVTAIVRGDFEVNETKLANAIKAFGGLRPAQADEIRAAGMEPGYASPIGAEGAMVVVDALAAASPNLVAGANRHGYHLRNVNVNRDFTADVVTDIANVREGDPCPTCGTSVVLRRGIEVGNIFKLGTDFTVPMGATYLAEDGSRHPVVMGSYGIGLGRNLACVVEAHHDEKGIVWPAEIAPYAVHLVSIGAGRDENVATEAEGLYARLTDAGVEVLYDDRDETPGVKLTDAELLGMPTIVTISPRSLAAGGAEVTQRASGERSVIPIAELEATLRS
jgi:prolyl-tRNA synthetase